MGGEAAGAAVEAQLGQGVREEGWWSRDSVYNGH